MPFKGRMSEDNAKRLGARVGQFLSIDRDDYSGLEKSMRIRVLLDVRKPLKTHVNLKLREGEVCSVKVKYENLPNFCFNCGRMGHGVRDCIDGIFDSKNPRYGIWLRASPWKTVRKEEEVEEGRKMLSPKARNLFFTKDMEPIVKVNRETIDVMASLLKKVSVTDTLGSKQDEGDPILSKRHKEYAEEALVVHSNNSSQGVDDEGSSHGSVGVMGTTNDQDKSSNDGSKYRRKKWHKVVRVEGRKDVLKGALVVVGHKRTCEIEGHNMQPMEIDDSGVILKKYRLSNSMISMGTDRQEVASPTNRALGES